MLILVRSNIITTQIYAKNIYFRLVLTNIESGSFVLIWTIPIFTLFFLNVTVSIVSQNL